MINFYENMQAGSIMVSRNQSLDLLKVILAVLVIAIHVFPSSGFDGISGVAYYFMANSVSRIAVPLFFIISGYLLGASINKHTLLKTVKRIGKLFLVWQIIYFPLFYSGLLPGQIGVKIVFFNLIYGYWHLWYLSGYIVGLILLYYIQKQIMSPKLQLLLAVALYLIGYGYQLWINNTPNWYVYDIGKIYEYIGSPRNGIFMGLPMLIIGSLYSYWQSKIKNVGIFLSLVALFVIEVGIYEVALPLNMDFYLFVLPLGMYILSYVIKNPNISSWKLDRNMSLGIYLIHPIIVHYAKRSGIFGDWYFIMYFAVIVTTVFAWYTANQVNKKLRILF